MRQALAGMLWSKQFYHYDVDKWLEERGSDPFKATRKQAPRNDHWHHMYNGDVISMPDKWEYPWYAAWDLAFHVLALTLVDPDFGKQQLKLMLRERYMHPNGQIPAYEWNFGDVNPPVHAWSTIFTYRLEKAQTGEGDKDWLKSSFQKLLLNFTWWVNRKDRSGRNVFEGGFLGLDNIGVFDRSAPLPTGGYLEQADGTAWMALFCQNMLEIAAELAMTDPDYADMALKFVEHFLWIASSMAHLGGETGMWDEEDGFFYDVLRLPDGQAQRLKVRSMVGLLPLCAATVFDGKLLAKYPEIGGAAAAGSSTRGPRSAPRSTTRMKTGVAGRRLASILDETKLRRVLAKMLDENEFLSQFGIRSLSRYHAEHPLRHPRRRPGVPRRLPAGRVRHRHVRRQLELARADLDAGQRPDHPGTAAVLHLLRQRLHRRMPDRLRPADEPVPGGRGDQPAAGEHLPRGQGRPPAGLRRHARSSRTTRTGATSSSSTSTSTATTAPGSAPATRPAGPASSPGSCTCSRRPRPSRCSNSASGRGITRGQQAPDAAGGRRRSRGEVNRKDWKSPCTRNRWMSSRSGCCSWPCASSRAGLEGGYGSAGGGAHAATEEKETPVGAMVGSILALFAFMLAFTFGMAGAASRRAARWYSRRPTPSARPTCEPACSPSPAERERPAAAGIRRRPRARHPGRQGGGGHPRSEELHELLWAEAAKAAENNPGPDHQPLHPVAQPDDRPARQRVQVGMRSRIPLSIWAGLFALGPAGDGLGGLPAGLSATRRSPAMLGLVLAFAGVLFLIADLDRAQEGLLTVSQQAMIDLQRTMKASP